MFFIEQGFLFTLKNRNLYSMDISIIMPVKNAHKWVEETIRSIEMQSFENWELICIDDHSIDDSFELIGQMSLLDSRIRIVTNEGYGIIPALQQGLKLARGKYITRMDADDLMPVNRLQHFYNALEGTTNTLVTGKVKYFTCSSEPVSEGYLKYEAWLNNLIDQNNFYDEIFRECIIASPNWMCRKDDLIRYDIFNELEYPEDYSMCFLWLKNHFKIIGLNEITLYWRDHLERTSRNSDVYNQESFFNLKIKWFTRSIPQYDAKIGVLGAQRKGKLTVDILQHNGIEKIGWYDYNYQNYNAPLKGLNIEDYEKVSDDYLLISVYPKSKRQLNTYLNQHGYVVGKNAWYL